MVDEKKKKAGNVRWIGVPKAERKVLASKAAHARWKDADVRVADYPGTIDLAGFKLQCAVLDDGSRVLSERGVSDSLQYARHPGDYADKLTAAAAGQEVLPAFLTPTVANFLPGAVRHKLANPIRYRMKKGFGIPAIAIEATVLADICEAFLAAREAGVLQHDQLATAQAADRLMRALARVALVALIDEATGFQVVRDRDELQRLLEAYVSPEHRPWMQKFPNEFYIEMFRLRGITTDDIRKRPPYFGHLTNNLVYSRMLPGLLPRLDEVNPVTANGRRARTHHAHLVKQGEQHLDRHMAGLIYLMRASANWAEFTRALDRASPTQPNALPEAKT